jgi:hypothetical protein
LICEKLTPPQPPPHHEAADSPSLPPQVLEARNPQMNTDEHGFGRLRRQRPNGNGGTAAADA